MLEYDYLDSSITRDTTLYMVFHLRGGAESPNPPIFTNRMAKGVDPLCKNFPIRVH